jgi:transcriptional regulator with XRE-family HTH domain
VNRLGTWREAKRWSQKKLAAHLGCSQQQVSKYEKDIGDPARKVPKPGELLAIFELTAGELDPNYFHGITLAKTRVAA